MLLQAVTLQVHLFEKKKLKPLRFLTNCREFQSIFQDIGEQPHTSDITRKGLEKFTCKIYGRSEISNINTLRYLKAQERFPQKGAKLLFKKYNADLSLLPPCLLSLNAYPELPLLEENGWKWLEV